MYGCIRATDGQNAKLKIGSKIPIATGSYSAGAATGITAGIGVQTQFTYLDVGVTIDMTPTIHLDREVSLKLDIVNSTQRAETVGDRAWHELLDRHNAIVRQELSSAPSQRADQ